MDNKSVGRKNLFQYISYSTSLKMIKPKELKLCDVIEFQWFPKHGYIYIL